MYYEPNDLFLLKRDNAKEYINLSRVNKSEDMPVQKTKTLAIIGGAMGLTGMIVYFDGNPIGGGILIGAGITVFLGIGMWHIAGGFLNGIMQLRGDAGSTVEELQSLDKPEVKQSGWTNDGRRTG